MRLSCLLATAFLTFAPAAQEPTPAPAVPTRVAFAATDGYPLDVCIVSGKELKADAKRVEIGGRAYRTCCGQCATKIEKDPETYAKKLDAAVVAAQTARYPLTACPISGKPLGSMGEPHALVVGNQLVKLCCKDCETGARAKIAAIGTQVQNEVATQQSPAYSAKVCPVSGNQITEKAALVVHGTSLVKLCCEGCLETFSQQPNAMTVKALGAVQSKAGAGAPAQDEGSCCGVEAAKSGGSCCGGEGKSGGSCCETPAQPAKK